MSFVRINVSLPEKIFKELSKNIEPRKRSKFITDSIKSSLRGRRAQKLAAEYKEASAEIKRINQELEGSLNDGLD
jgi:metal-responsive CopG/Arc/MetJ family transcriptional regulator